MYGNDYDRGPEEKDFDPREDYLKALDKVYAEEDKRHTAAEKVKAKKFKEKNKGGFILVTSYADEDGNFFSTMEHGEIFRNLDHIVVSNH